MEMEENKGLNDKKAYEDQFTYFCQFGFGVLSLFALSLILLHTQRILGEM